MYYIIHGWNVHSNVNIQFTCCCSCRLQFHLQKAIVAALKTTAIWPPLSYSYTHTNTQTAVDQSSIQKNIYFLSHHPDNDDDAAARMSTSQGNRKGDDDNDKKGKKIIFNSSIFTLSPLLLLLHNSNNDTVSHLNLMGFQDKYYSTTGRNRRESLEN